MSRVAQSNLAWQVMPRSFLLSLLLCIGGALAGCSTSAPAQRTQQAVAMAQQQGWQPLSLPGDVFDLQAFVPEYLANHQMSNQGHDQARHSGHLTIYIEGDGKAWVDHRTPAFTPTPSDPLALRLAMADSGSSGAVAYLGRPCQYTRGESFKHCETRYWGSHRFSPEVIRAMDGAVDQLKQRAAAESITLVGYSGGAALAALLASQRQDVRQLITVAGNLDIEAWINTLGLSPLSGSLNPADVSSRLSSLPQWHWIGGQDETVPGTVLASYLQRGGISASGNRQIRVRSMAGFDHHCCWAKAWPDIVATMQQSR